jgi:hypothetical protein
MTQMELESQLGGLFSLLTVEFLVPYLNRKLSVAQKLGEIPSIPKKIVKPTIVAGINALGRGQDREALTGFLTLIAQTMGPEALQSFINPEEAIKRLAASSGIDVLNLVKGMQEIEEQKQQNLANQKEIEITKQVGQLASTPLMDPTKNPEALNMINGQNNSQSPEESQQQTSSGPVPRGS